MLPLQALCQPLGQGAHVATGLSTAQLGHAPRIKAGAPAPGSSAWAGAAVVRPQVGLDKLQRRGKPGAVERGREATCEVLGMLWGSGSSQSQVSQVCWSPSGY